jgi:aminoglycoside phosphotransferase (APT) family kinase protein
MVSIGNTFYIFMTYLPGTPLKELWPTLTRMEKPSVQDQLNVIMKVLRGVSYNGEPLGGGAFPRCKDVRGRFKRHSSTIHNEAEFNEFLLSDPHSNTSEPYIRLLLSMLQDKNRIVMTHGDLHQGNILAIRRSGTAVDMLERSTITISGIVDWEMGGWYPECWEYVRALDNTIHSI